MTRYQKINRLSETSGTAAPVRVLLVDDSPSLLGVLSQGLSGFPGLEVVGTAYDAYDARDKIKSLAPDVITLDVEMPRMNGLDFLERIMRLRPMPVVMFSSITEKGGVAAVRALSLGAVDVMVKPTGSYDRAFFQDMAARILAAGRRASSDRAGFEGLQPQVPSIQSGNIQSWNGRIVLIGASTGGVAALETVISGLPRNCPPIVISQHMPETFLKSFVARLDDRNPQSVQLAEDGARLDAGTIHIAPGGDAHLGVEQRGGGFYCKTIRGSKTNGHYPSVDELFLSAIDFAERTVGVILTGLGHDGAAGLARLRQNGASTIGQDSATCVVYGMPRAAAELDALDQQLPISVIAGAICRACDRRQIKA